MKLATVATTVPVPPDDVDVSAAPLDTSEWDLDFEFEGVIPFPDADEWPGEFGAARLGIP